MAYLYMRHKVKDHAKWLIAFDSVKELRKAAGEKSFQVFHPDDDPNNLLLLFEWESLEMAHAHMHNPELKQVMKDAGVAETPEVYFLKEYAHGELG